jgi:hypothetical protein
MVSLRARAAAPAWAPAWAAAAAFSMTPPPLFLYSCSISIPMSLPGSTKDFPNVYEPGHLYDASDTML